MKLTIRVISAAVIPSILLLITLLYQLTTFISLEKQSSEREDILKYSLVVSRIDSLLHELENTAGILSSSRDTAEAIQEADTSFLYEWSRLFHSDKISKILFTDSKGLILSRSDNHFIFSNDLSDTAPVKQALSGESTRGFFRLDGTVHLASTKPVYLHRDNPLGTVVVAVEITPYLLDTLTQGSGLGLRIRFDDNLYTSSEDHQSLYYTKEISFGESSGSLLPSESSVFFYQHRQLLRMEELRKQFSWALLLVSLLLPLVLILTLRGYLRPYSILLTGLSRMAKDRGSFQEVRDLFRKTYTRSKNEVSLIAAAVSEFTLAMEENLVKLEQLSTTDQLTGLCNRRHIDLVLHSEIERAERYHTAFSVLLCDVDHFKKINDDLGHNEGDQVLQEIARALKKNCRSTDIISRWGGEEFLILSPGVSLEGAVILAEKLRGAVSSLAIHTRWKTKGSLRAGTLSIGVAQYRTPDSPSELIIRADKALYRAKTAGRNRVISAG
ncbi:MAG: diguanylate cyclase [Spirochaetales bacterium]|nr:diguanylate cyclase [Spirochaetales bacterium]